MLFSFPSPFPPFSFLSFQFFLLMRGGGGMPWSQPTSIKLSCTVKPVFSFHFPQTQAFVGWIWVFAQVQKCASYCKGGVSNPDGEVMCCLQTNDPWTLMYLTLTAPMILHWTIDWIAWIIFPAEQEVCMSYNPLAEFWLNIASLLLTCFSSFLEVTLKCAIAAT